MIKHSVLRLPVYQGSNLVPADMNCDTLDALAAKGWELIAVLPAVAPPNAMPDATWREVWLRKRDAVQEERAREPDRERATESTVQQFEPAPPEFVRGATEIRLDDPIPLTSTDNRAAAPPDRLETGTQTPAPPSATSPAQASRIPSSSTRADRQLAEARRLENHTSLAPRLTFTHRNNRERQV